MSTFLIIVLILLIVGIISSSSNSKNRKKHSEKTHDSIKPKTNARGNTIKPYYSEKIYHFVKGIWAEKGRIKEFHSLKNEEFVDIKFEPDNQYDKNALAVYSKRGIKLGYLPRNRRKLILTLKSNPNILARVHSREEFYSNKRGKQVYSLCLELWVGCDHETLTKMESGIFPSNSQFIKFVNLSFQLSQLKKDFSNLQKTDPKLALEQTHALSLEILGHNEIASTDHQVKIPLDQLTKLTQQLKLHHETIQFVEFFLDKTSMTEKQKVRILTRVEQAKSLIMDQPTSSLNADGDI